MKKIKTISILIISLFFLEGCNIFAEDITAKEEISGKELQELTKNDDSLSAKEESSKMNALAELDKSMENEINKKPEDENLPIPQDQDLFQLMETEQIVEEFQL